MGTRFELVLAADEMELSVTSLRAVGELAIGEIDDWHRRLTRFEPDSWLSHVNRTAARESVRLDADTMDLFRDATHVWRDSQGAFDITRGDGGALEFDPDEGTLRFAHDKVAIDLGGIGKGHAIECAARCLRSHGVTRALLHGGTSSGIAIGRPLDGAAWRIGVSDNVIDLVDSSFSVSDEASQPAAPFGRHITDPRASGVEAADQPARRAIVTGPSARLTDAWSTALVVLGNVPEAFPPEYEARFLRQ